LYIYLDIENLKETFENNIRILHLVLYSPGGSYDKMHEATSPLYKNIKNVDTYYYCFSPDIPGDYKLDDDILYIKGDETFIPGILDKTIKAFEYFKDDLPNYTYIVRSNISTVIDFTKLKKELINQEVNFGGGVMMHLSSLNPPYGKITEENEHWLGTSYPSGTAIIFSSDTLQKLLTQTDKLHREVIDDVALGLHLRENNPEVEPKQIGKFTFVQNMADSEDGEMEKMVKTNDFIFYRNHNGNRELDANQIKKLSHILSLQPDDE
jgi:hypothetical protein